jgi:hypothetical protein
MPPLTIMYSMAPASSRSIRILSRHVNGVCVCVVGGGRSVSSVSSSAGLLISSGCPYKDIQALACPGSSASGCQMPSRTALLHLRKGFRNPYSLAEAAVPADTPHTHTHLSPPSCAPAHSCLAAPSQYPAAHNKHTCRHVSSAWPMYLCSPCTIPRRPLRHMMQCSRPKAARRPPHAACR